MLPCSAVTCLLRRAVVPIGAMVLAAALSASAALAQLSDVKGSKDHPMVSRYAGSVIIGYDFRKFDEFVIPLGPLKRAANQQDFELAKSQRVEGRVTRILYVGPPDRSPLEIVRNYELELKKSGFEPFYTCAATQCGEEDGSLTQFYLYTLEKRLSQTPPPGIGRQDGQVSEYALATPVNQRYLAMKREAGRQCLRLSVCRHEQIHGPQGDARPPGDSAGRDRCGADRYRDGHYRCCGDGQGYFEHQPRGDLWHLFRHGQGRAQA